jgi:hypothetical protein
MRLAVLAALALVAIPTSAHAMGGYTSLAVVAWSDDGSAVLLTHDSSSSGTVGSTHSYLLIGAGDTAPAAFTFDDTQDPDTVSQKVDVATCQDDADRLRNALADKGFRGVKIRTDHCKSDRAVVSISRAASKRVAKSRPAGAPGVFTATGVLIVIVAGENGDDSPGAHAMVIEAGESGPAVLVDDLR